MLNWLFAFLIQPRIPVHGTVIFRVSLPSLEAPSETCVEVSQVTDYMTNHLDIHISHPRTAGECR